MILLDALILYCKEHKISIRQFAKETGIGHGTAIRSMNGTPPDGDNLARILIWALQPSPQSKDKETKSSAKSN